METTRACSLENPALSNAHWDDETCVPVITLSAPSTTGSSVTQSINGGYIDPTGPNRVVDGPPPPPGPPSIGSSATVTAPIRCVLDSALADDVFDVAHFNYPIVNDMPRIGSTYIGVCQPGAYCANIGDSVLGTCRHTDPTGSGSGQVGDYCGTRVVRYNRDTSAWEEAAPASPPYVCSQGLICGLQGRASQWFPGGATAFLDYLRVNYPSDFAITIEAAGSAVEGPTDLTRTVCKPPAGPGEPCGANWEDVAHDGTLPSAAEPWFDLPLTYARLVSQVCMPGLTCDLSAPDAPPGAGLCAVPGAPVD